MDFNVTQDVTLNVTHEKKVNPKLVITEDSNSGYQFFDYVCRENHLQCETMNGKFNIFHYLREHKNEKILVIADGAAFGSEIDRVLRLIEECENVAYKILLPTKKAANLEDLLLLIVLFSYKCLSISLALYIKRRTSITSLMTT